MCHVENFHCLKYYALFNYCGLCNTFIDRLSAHFTKNGNSRNILNADDCEAKKVDGHYAERSFYNDFSKKHYEIYTIYRYVIPGKLLYIFYGWHTFRTYYRKCIR